MRLRWITILCVLTLKLALVGAVLLLGRFVLTRNYTALEHQHVEADIEKVCIILESQLKDLDLMAHDYAAWDATFDFMRHRRSHYVDSDLSPNVLRARRIRLYMLVDPHLRILMAESFVDNSGDTLPADIAELLRAINRRPQPDSIVSGLMNLTNGPAMIAIWPVMPTRETGPPRGTLILVRDLGPEYLGEISRMVALPISVSGTFGDSAETSPATGLIPSSLSATDLDENRVLGSTMIQDVWGNPSIRLQIEHDREIWLQGRRTLNILFVVVLVVGVLFALVNVGLMERLVVRRVEKLIQLTRDAENDSGLSARVQLSGRDELAKLGYKMNQMLQHLQNSRDKLLAVQERLRYEATHDNLTGIWNRGAALQLLDQELARSSRDGSPVAVMMLDADHFKQINDRFGHATGDRALQAIAATITRNLRGFDVCCRYGGEEFLVIAPRCDRSQALHVAGRVLASLREAPVSLPQHSFCVTLSAGIACSAAPCNAEDLIMAADRALYRAKAQGRNRVEVEDLPEGASVRSMWLASGNLETLAP